MCKQMCNGAGHAEVLHARLGAPAPPALRRPEDSAGQPWPPAPSLPSSRSLGTLIETCCSRTPCWGRLLSHSRLHQVSPACWALPAASSSQACVQGHAEGPCRPGCCLHAPQRQLWSSGAPATLPSAGAAAAAAAIRRLASHAPSCLIHQRACPCLLLQPCSLCPAPQRLAVWPPPAPPCSAPRRSASLAFQLRPPAVDVAGCNPSAVHAPPGLPPPTAAAGAARLPTRRTARQPSRRHGLPHWHLAAQQLSSCCWLPHASPPRWLRGRGQLLWRCSRQSCCRCHGCGRPWSSQRAGLLSGRPGAVAARNRCGSYCWLPALGLHWIVGTHCNMPGCWQPASRFNPARSHVASRLAAQPFPPLCRSRQP